MKALAVLLMLSVSGVVAAADIEATDILLRGVDKITGRTQMSEAQVGSQTRFGGLIVNAEKCLKHPPEETPENAAFLRISEVGADGTETEVFNGWMFSSNPALSAMEHPVYDIWVVDCRAPETTPEWAVNPAEIALPAVRQNAVDIEPLPELEEAPPPFDPDTVSVF